LVWRAFEENSGCGWCRLYWLAYISRAALEREQYQVSWHEYQGMAHSVSAQEIVDMPDLRGFGLSARVPRINDSDQILFPYMKQE